MADNVRLLGRDMQCFSSWLFCSLSPVIPGSVTTYGRKPVFMSKVSTKPSKKAPVIFTIISWVCSELIVLNFRPSWPCLEIRANVIRPAERRHWHPDFKMPSSRLPRSWTTSSPQFHIWTDFCELHSKINAPDIYLRTDIIIEKRDHPTSRFKERKKKKGKLYSVVVTTTSKDKPTRISRPSPLV